MLLEFIQNMLSKSVCIKMFSVQNRLCMLIFAENAGKNDRKGSEPPL